MNLPHPLPTLLTGELLLRPLRPDDADTVARLTAESGLRDKSDWVPATHDDAAAAAWIREQSGDSRAAWAITHEERGILYGVVGLFFDAERDSAELRLWVGVPYENENTALLAGRAVVRAAFSEWQARRLEARHAMSDHASEQIFRQFGFLPEGVRRQSEKWNGRFVDIAHHGMLQTDVVD